MAARNRGPVRLDHPRRACYLLGAEDFGLKKEALDLCHQVVRIPSKFCLNVSTTGSIVMFDRNSKLEGGKWSDTRWADLSQH